MSNNIENYLWTTGTSTAYVVNSNSLSVFSGGQLFFVKIHIKNTGSSTLDINGTGPRLIKKNGSNLVAGELILNSLVVFRYVASADNFEIDRVENFVQDTPLESAQVASALGLTELELSYLEGVESNIQDQIDALGGASAPSGTGFVKVTSGVYDTPGPLSATDIAGLSGVINDAGTTGGTSTAYTATLASRPEPLTAGYTFQAVFNASNGTAPTIALSSGTAQSIWLNGAAIPTNTLIASTPYILRSDGTRCHVVAGQIGKVIYSDCPTTDPGAGTPWDITYAGDRYSNIVTGKTYHRRTNNVSVEILSASVWAMGATSQSQTIGAGGSYKVTAGEGQIYLGTIADGNGLLGTLLLAPALVSQSSNGTWTNKVNLSSKTWTGRFEIYDNINADVAASYKVIGTTLTLISGGAAEYVASGSEAAGNIAWRISGGYLQINVGTSVGAGRKLGVSFGGSIV